MTLSEFSSTIAFAWILFPLVATIRRGWPDLHFGLNLEMVSTGTDSCLTLSLLQLTSITKFNDTDFQFNRTQVLAQRMKVRQRKREWKREIEREREGKKKAFFCFNTVKHASAWELRWNPMKMTRTGALEMMEKSNRLEEHFFFGFIPPCSLTEWA